MGVEIGNAVGEFIAEDQRLPEAPYPIPRAVAAEIAKPGGARRGVARPSAHGLPRPHHTEFFVAQILGQIVNRRLDVVVDGVVCGVGWVPQRNDLDRETAPFEREDFLGDECFGKAGIAFEDKGNFSCHCGTQAR